MPNEILQKTGTPVVWAKNADYSSSVSGLSRTHEIDLASLANNAARQGAKADLGATRARQYAVRVCGHLNATGTSGNVIEYWWAASASGTAGTGNDGDASGSDAAYKASNEDACKQQLTYLGAFVYAAEATTNARLQTIGIFTPPERYGMPVVVNKSGQSLKNDGVSQMVALIPLIDEVQ